MEAARLATESEYSCVIMTRQKHVAALQAALKAEDLSDFTRIISISAGRQFEKFLKDGSRGHSLAWQLSAYRVLRSMQRSPGKLVAHHVTFASDTLPSAIHLPGLGGVRRIWGPVGSSDARLEAPTTYLRQVLVKIKRIWFRFLCSQVNLVVVQTGHVAARLHGLAVDVVIEQNCIVSDRPASMDHLWASNESHFKPRVAVVGVLTKRKRPQLAIDALRATGNGLWDLVILGDGPLRQKLEDSNRDLVERGALRFTGWLSHREAQEEMARCVGLIHPSVREGAPWAIAEALSQGKWVATVAGNGADYLVGLVPGGGTVVSNEANDIGSELGSAVMQMLAKVDRPEGSNRWTSSRFRVLLREWYACD